MPTHEKEKILLTTLLQALHTFRVKISTFQNPTFPNFPQGFPQEFSNTQNFKFYTQGLSKYRSARTRFLPRPRRLCFHPCMYVCLLSVKNTTQNYTDQIFVKFYGMIGNIRGTNWLRVKPSQFKFLCDQLLVTVPFMSLHRGHGTAYHLPSELFHPSPPFGNNWRHICLGFLYPPHCYYDSVKCPCIVRVTASLKSVHC